MKITLLVVTLVALLIQGCGESTHLADGGGVETTAMVGDVVKSDGSPAIAVRVHLRDAEYLRDPNHPKIDPGDTIVTDEFGRYRISKVRRGKYLLEMGSAEARSAMLMYEARGLAKDTLPLAMLQAEGSLSGIIKPPPGTRSIGFVQILGLDRAVKSDSATGRFDFVALPPGKYSLRYSHSEGSESLVQDNITVYAGRSDTMATVVLGWARSHALTLNTTTTGADIHSDLAGFPTLVRADSSWFDFAEARPDGSDILVFSAEGKPLPVEINEWNAVKKEGQIWIRLDSLKANTTTRLHLVWGNTKVTQLLSLPVFDTTDSHLAVLHLESANSMAEATGSLKVGLDSGSTKVKGIIGEAIQFKTGTNNILTYLDEGKLGVAKTLENLQGCTFSWWMRPDENLDTVSTRRTLFAKGQGWDGDVDEDWAIWIKGGALILEGRVPSGVDSSDWIQATFPAGPWEMGRWHYMAIVNDGKSAQLFKNGEAIGMAIPFDHTFIPSNDTPALSIGKHSLSRPELSGFSGAIDEIRIQQKTLSIEWIRACYRNQAMHNALVNP